MSFVPSPRHRHFSELADRVAVVFRQIVEVADNHGFFAEPSIPTRRC